MKAVATHPAESDTSHHLLRGAYSLLTNTALTSALGMGFWIAAARLYSSTSVGRDTVLVSVMIELSTICQLNLANGILRFLPNLGERITRALVRAYMAAAAAALLIGGAFVLLAPRLSHELAFLRNEPAIAAAFVLTLMLWGLFTLQDAALTATRQAPWIPVENGVFGVLKLTVLPILLALGALHGIFLSWAIPMALLLIPVNLFIFRRAIPEHFATTATAAHSLDTPSLGRRRQTVRFLGQDYAASVLTQATLTSLPLVVIATLGARESAYFAMPFAIVLAFDTFAYSACTSLVVEATLDSEHLAKLTALFVRRVLVLVVLAALLLAIAAPLVMLPFGHSYAAHGSGVLRLLLLASCFRAVTALFSAVCRVQALGLRLVAVELALLVLVLATSIAMVHQHGIEGVAAAWLVANALIGVVAAVLLGGFLRNSKIRHPTPGGYK